MESDTDYRNRIELERIELEVCVDCLFFDANGELPEDPEDAKRVEEAFSGLERFHYANACPEECEGWFSWSRCDMCGSPLGGERHPAVLIPVRLP